MLPSPSPQHPGAAAPPIRAGVALPAPDSLGWWLGRPLWLGVALTLTALVAMLFARVEAG